MVRGTTVSTVRCELSIRDGKAVVAAVSGAAGRSRRSTVCQPGRRAGAEGCGECGPGPAAAERCVCAFGAGAGAPPTTSPAGAPGPKAWPSGARNRGSCQEDRIAVNFAAGLILGSRVATGWIAGRAAQSRRGAVTGGRSGSPAAAVSAVSPRHHRLQGRIRSHSLLAPGIDPDDLVDEPQPFRVLQIEQIVEGPMQVVGQVPDLPVQPVGRVGQDSPRRPPASSTRNSCRHSGQAAETLVWPSLLTVR